MLVPRSLALALAGALLFCLLVSGAGLPAAEAATQVHLRTAYLTERLGGARSVAIRGTLGGSGQITFDGNTCALGPFGDPSVCTEIAFAPVQITLRPLKLADPSGQRRRLYRLEGPVQPDGWSYTLVVPPRRSGVHRLLVDQGAGRTRVVTLERAQAPPKPTAQWALSEGTYGAAWDRGQIVITATGKSRSAGWQVKLERLPTRIWPPQFKLVQLAPKGMSAQVITPFEVTTSFEAAADVTRVFVHDAKGQHAVPVRVIGDR